VNWYSVLLVVFFWEEPVKPAARQSLKVGIFVVGLTMTLFGSVFVLGGATEMFRPKYKLYGTWADVAGLKEGAIVRLAGWDVGEVSAIRFSDDLARRELTVQMNIHARYQERIRTDSEARIDTVGVLGDKYVSISMGSPEQEILQGGESIITRAPLDLLGYTKKFEDILHNTSSISRKFDLMLGDEEEVMQAKVAKSLEHMESLLSAAESGNGLLHALIYDDEMTKNVGQILRNVEVATANLAHMTAEVKMGKGLANQLIYGQDGAALARELGDLATALAGLTRDIKNEDSLLHAMLYDPEKAKVLDDLAATMASLRSTSEAIDAGEGTLGMLANDPSLYEDLRALVGGAQRNKLLRSYIRRTIQRGEDVNSGAWEPAE
jgi:phospholipid/cholesterol/gamma-HCH transport system substrate-binding protein